MAAFGGQVRPNCIVPEEGWAWYGLCGNCCGDGGAWYGWLTPVGVYPGGGAAVPRLGVSRSITEEACRASAEATGAGSQSSPAAGVPGGSSMAASCAGSGRRAGSLVRQAVITGSRPGGSWPSSGWSCTTR